jgi:PAS domain S-box-containing protein
MALKPALLRLLSPLSQAAHRKELAAQRRARARAEALAQELQRSEDRFRSLVEATSLIVWRADANGETVGEIPGWEELTGQPVEAQGGSVGWLAMVHPEDREGALRRWQQSVDGKTASESRYRLARRDGGYAWVVDRAVPVQNPDGSVREWVGTVTDVSEQRRAEDGLRFLAEASKSLTASVEAGPLLEALARAPVPLFADLCAIHLLDPRTGHYQLVAAHHRSPELNEFLRELSRRYPLSAGAPLFHPAVIRTGKAELHSRVTEELLGALASGPEHLQLLRRLALWSVLILPLQMDNQTVGAITFATGSSLRMYEPEDVALATEVARRASVGLDNARLYALARAERQRAEEASRAKDVFLATVSHELRTPLTAILGWAGRLRGKLSDAQGMERAISIIERNARAQAQLIEDILDVSRIIAGRLRLDIRPVELHTVLESAVDAVRPAAEAKGLRLVVDLGVEPQTLQADADRLQQAVWNLLNNAVKFTAPGGEIHLTARPEEGAALITVQDTGQGIAAEFLPHVFEGFRQADGSSTRRHGGLGLGLAIVRHLVELHGGAANVTSAGEGQGATFSLRIPMRAETPVAGTDAGQELFVSPVRVASPSLLGLSVLVVDDEQDVRDWVASILEESGATVRVAASAQEGFDFLRQERPAVLISDVGMPGEDGYGLIRWVRALPSEAGGRTPAVALTAYAARQDRTRVLLEGFQLHLAKPVEPAELVAAVANLGGRLAPP